MQLFGLSIRIRIIQDEIRVHPGFVHSQVIRINRWVVNIKIIANEWESCLHQVDES